MKKILLLSLIIIGFFQLGAQEAPVRNCATFEGFYERLEADPAFRQNIEAVVRSPRQEVEVSVRQRYDAERDLMEVPVFVDLSGRPGLQLGSFSADVRWDPQRLRLLDWEGGTAAGFETPVVNDSQAASGVLTLADADPVGAGGLVHLFTLRMERLRPGADPALQVTVGSLTGAGTFEGLRGRVRYEAEHLAPAQDDFLLSTHPNPFRQEVRIQYRLASSQRVLLAVYDYAGREVQRLADGQQPAGDHFLRWNGSGRDGQRLPAGLYFLRLNSETGHATEKLILVRE